MPWKDGYTTTDDRSLDDADVRWPDGQRLAFTVVVDLSLASGPGGVTPADLAGSRALFALGDGLDQVLTVLARHGVRATFTVPGVMARMLQPTLEKLRRAGHEIAANGYRHEDVSGLDEAEERARLALTTELIGDAIGERPQGWFSLPRQGDRFALGSVSANTIRLLAEAGYAYMGNGPADDIPYYWVHDAARAEALLTLPYYYHHDDQFFLLFPAEGSGLEHADSLYRNWCAELDAQYRRGRHFAMTLHPYAVGWCHRAKLLDDFLARAGRLPGVWNATGAECAAYWTAAYPASTTLRLAPSIWQDHPGSLS